MSEIKRELPHWYSTANIYILSIYSHFLSRWQLVCSGRLWQLLTSRNSGEIWAPGKLYAVKFIIKETCLLPGLHQLNVEGKKTLWVNLNVSHALHCDWMNRATHGQPLPTCWVGAAVPGWPCWTVCCMSQEAMTAPAAWTLWSGSTPRPTPGREWPQWTYAGSSAVRAHSSTEEVKLTLPFMNNAANCRNCQNSF